MIRCEDYVMDNHKNLLNSVLNNLTSIKNNFAVIIAMKITRKMFKNTKLYEKVLSFYIFSKIYSLTKCENFLASSEVFRLLFSMVIDEKISKNIFCVFLIKHKQEICDMINEKLRKKDENYFVKRDTLMFVLYILEDISHNFEDFKEYYLSRLDDLKVVMALLNHSCARIKIKAVAVLFYFFVDLEYKVDAVKLLLLTNKNNFENYFIKGYTCINDADITEKKNYILYELERLQNIC